MTEVSVPGRRTEFDFEASIWRWREGSWRFVTVPEDVSDDIEEASQGRTGGFGSVPVTVTIGATTWQTSLFPSAEEAAYVLPVKKAVRTAEGLADGDPARVHLHLRG